MPESLKMAATSSLTVFRSAVPSAMLCLRSAALRCVGGSAAPLCRACPSAPASACTPRLWCIFYQPRDHLSLMGYNSKVYFVRLFLL